MPLVQFLGNALKDTSKAFNSGILITTATLAGGSNVAGSVNAVVNGNVITNATNLTSIGIQVSTANTNLTSITLNAVSNQFINSTIGVIQQAGVSGTNLHFNANAFLGTTAGYEDFGVSGTTTDATYNYWGVPNGPTITSNANTNTGAKIIDQTSGGGSGIVNYGFITSTSGNYLPTSTGAGSFLVSVTPTSSAPTSVPTFTVTVTALYVPGLVPILGLGTVDKNYQNAVALSSSGLLAPINGNNTYTFTAADQGVHQFPKVASGNTFGSAPVVVTDSSTATAAPANVVQGKSANVSITGDTTTTTVTIPAAFTYSNSNYTATATVTPGGTAASAPTGTVNFFLDGGYIGSAPITTTSGTSGIASFTFKPSTFGVSAGNHTILAAYATDGVFNSSTSTSKTVLIEKTPANPFGVTAVGSGSGIASLISVTTSTGTKTFSPFGGFLGGVRVAVADVYGTGTPDIIAAAGPGGTPTVSIFNTSGTLLQTFLAYGSGFSGGVYVAAANLTASSGGTHAEIITGTGALVSGQALVDTYFLSAVGATPTLINQFNAYSGTAGQNGVVVAAGDLYGNGSPVIATSQVFPSSGFIANLNTNINVYTYNSNTLSYTLKSTYTPFGSFAGGAYVAIVSTATGGKLVVSAGAGGNATVAVIDTYANSTLTFNAIPSGQGQTYKGGGIIASADPIAAADGTFASGDILTGQRIGGDATVNAFDGVTLGFIKSFVAFPGDINGVYLAGA